MSDTEITSERKPRGRPKGSISKPKTPEISDAELRILCLKFVWDRQPRSRLAEVGPIVEDLMDYARTGNYGEFSKRNEVNRSSSHITRGEGN